MFPRASTGETMRARRGPLIKAIPARFRVFFDGARCARTGRCFAALAEAENTSGEDGGNLAAALGRGHGGRIVQRIGHCGLLADVPTTACPLGPARCLAGSRIPYWLYTRRKFELSVGSGTNGVVNWRGQDAWHPRPVAMQAGIFPGISLDSVASCIKMT